MSPIGKHLKKINKTLHPETSRKIIDYSKVLSRTSKGVFWQQCRRGSGGRRVKGKPGVGGSGGRIGGGQEEERRTGMGSDVIESKGREL